MGRRAGRPGRKWVVVGGLGITQSVGYGVLYFSFGVLLLPMRHDLGWSRVSLTGAYSLAILVSGLAAVGVGRAFDRHDPRILLSAGSILSALLVFAWSRVSNLWELYAVFIGLGVGMALTLYEAAFVVLAKLFRDEERTAAFATLTTLAAPAAIVFAPLAELLVRHFGWRTAVATLAAVLVIGTLPVHLFVVRSGPVVGAGIDHGETAPTRRSVMGLRSFWMLVAAFFLGSFATIAIVVHLVSVLVAGGWSPVAAAYVAGFLGLAQVPGRLLFPLAARRLVPGARIGAVFGIGAVSLVLLASTRSAWAVFLFAALFGLANGVLTLLRATLVADLYGRANYGAISGVVGAFSLAGRAAAPLGAALISLAPGGYTTLLLSLAVMSGAGALLGAVGVSHSQAMDPTLVATGS